MRAFLAALGLVILGGLPAAADEVVGTYGRWQLERAELPDGGASFHTLRTREVTGEPSRLALSCAGGRQVPYLSHGEMEKLTGERETAVTIAADGRESVETTVTPIGNLGLLGSIAQHEGLIRLLRSADEVVTIRVRRQLFVFTAAGFRAGAVEMDRICGGKSAELR